MYIYTYICICMYTHTRRAAREEVEKNIGHGSKHRHRATNTPPSRHPRKRGKCQRRHVAIDRSGLQGKTSALQNRPARRKPKTVAAQPKTFPPPKTLPSSPLPHLHLPGVSARSTELGQIFGV